MKLRLNRSGFLFWSVMAFFVTCFSSVVAAPIQVSPWKGEFLAQKQGAFYVTLKYSGISAADARVELYNILTKKSYTLNLNAGVLSSGRMNLWKVPSGKYRLKSFTVVDTKGKKRDWKVKKRQSLVVKRQRVSNFGRWTIKAKGSDEVKISFSMIANTYKEEGSKKNSRIAAVVNGFTGLVQERFGGKKILDQSEDDFADDNELRATVTFTRNIAMYYKLNLFKHNYKAREIATVLSVYDNQVRTCYTDRLDFNERLRGDLNYKFIMSKSTGTMAKLSHVGGSANDPKLVECVYLVLAAIQFPVEQTMLGELGYTFDVK